MALKRSWEMEENPFLYRIFLVFGIENGCWDGEWDKRMELKAVISLSIKLISGEGVVADFLSTYC